MIEREFKELKRYDKVVMRDGSEIILGTAPFINHDSDDKEWEFEGLKGGFYDPYDIVCKKGQMSLQERIEEDVDMEEIINEIILGEYSMHDDTDNTEEIHDSDTILADLIDKSDHHFTGYANDIFEIYKDSKDKEAVEAMFYEFTGTKFSEYLILCAKNLGAYQTKHN